MVSLTTDALAQAAPAAPATAAASRSQASRPTWAELGASQRQALTPLAGIWESLSEPHKRKWIALAQNFNKMPAPEQAKLQARMADWAKLSPGQRTEARLNFAETQQLSADEKKAKWEAYQALPDEEKRKLAAGASATRTPPTAAAVKPVPAQKLTNIPKPANDDAKPARIVVSPAGESSGPSH